MYPDLEPHLKQLGLDAGASFREVTERYLSMRSGFPAVPSVRQRMVMRRLDETYEILRAAYKPRRAMWAIGNGTRTISITTIGVVALLLAGAFAALFATLSPVKLMMTSYDAGDTLRWKESTEPYGTVIRFEGNHQFAVGRPSAAYQIRLDDTNETVWVSERVVEKTMVAVH